MRTVCLLLSLGFTIIFFNSCEDSAPACIDTFASNYSVFADKECEDCCTYPNLSFSTSYLYGEEEKMDTSLYFQNSSSSYFKLKSFYVLLSEFTLKGDEGEYSVISKTEDKEITDDLLNIKFRGSSNVAGGIAIEDSIRTIACKIGLPEALDTPDSPDKDYPVIDILVDSMYYESGEFYKMLVEIEVDSMPETNILLAFPSLEERIEKTVVAGTTRGNRLNIQLSVDFLRLFNGIEFQNPNVAQEAKAIILENISEAIEFK